MVRNTRHGSSISKNIFASGLKYKLEKLEKTEIEHIVKNDIKTWTIKNEDVVKVEDTFNEFQKAVKDGFQLAYKVTANSLY